MVLVADPHHTDPMTYHLRITTEDSMHSRKVRKVLNIHNNKAMEDHQTRRMAEEEADVEVVDLVAEDMVSTMEEDSTAQTVFHEEEDSEIRL